MESSQDCVSRNAAHCAAPPFASDWALFLDVDGTLLPLRAHPAEVTPDPRALAVVTRLHALCGGAVALISGRALCDIDRLFPDSCLPVAAQHGLQRRHDCGVITTVAHRREDWPVIIAELRTFAALHAGTFVEDKGGTAALHYRLAPDAESAAFDHARGIASRAGYVVQRGKMVVELKPPMADKGLAIAAFLAGPPFAARRPVFLGDDATDEDGFAVVAAADGHAIKIGPGPTRAAWRLPDPPSALAWLEAYAEFLLARGGTS